MRVKIILIYFCVILVGIVGTLGWHYRNTVDIAEEEQVEKVLIKEEGRPVRILETAEEDGFFCVLYENESLDTLKIFKRTFLNRYKTWGGASVPKYEIGVFQYEEGNETVLVILYADNTKARYDQCIVETKQCDSSVTIGDYLISINQLVLDDKNPTVSPEITKNNGNILCKIK